jgi:outer membrane protein assembly factor BamB
MALQSDGKILVTTGSGSETVITTAPALPSAIAGSISRYNTNGTLDTNFAAPGQAACVASAAGIAIQNNGKIVVAGTITSGLATYSLQRPNVQQQPDRFRRGALQRKWKHRHDV